MGHFFLITIMEGGKEVKMKKVFLQAFILVEPSFHFKNRRNNLSIDWVL